MRGSITIAVAPFARQRATAFGEELLRARLELVVERQDDVPARRARARDVTTSIARPAGSRTTIS